MELVKLEKFIKTVLIIRLLSGFYSKISSNKIIAVLLKIYCVFVNVPIMFMALLNISDPKIYILAKLALGIPTIAYFVNAMVYIYLNGDNFNEFFYILKNLQITQDSESKYEIPVTIISIIAILSARLYNCIKLYWITQSGMVSCFIFLMFCMRYVGSVVRFMMFELLWRRMEILRKRLEQDLLYARRFENEADVLRRQLRTCLNIYKGLLDTTRKNDTQMKLLIFSSIVTLIPQILKYIFDLMLNNDLHYELIVFDIAILLFEALSPALLAEMVKREIDYMKLSVVKLLLVCKDKRTRDAIQDAMMYFQHNPFKYTIWRLFAVDMSLMLNMIALLTTYTVAMVQFAHFYD